MQLQADLYPVYNRQLMVLGRANNMLNKNETYNLHVNPKHHPIIILDAESNKNILKKVACHNGKIVLENVFKMSTNSWAEKKSLAEPNLVERMCNNGLSPLHGKKLTASAYSTRPYISIDEQDWTLEGGLFIAMFHVLAEYMHFDYEFIVSTNWFEFYSNGTIGASLGDVLNGRADVSLEQNSGLGPDMGDWSTYHTFPRDHVFMELKPKEIPKYKNIVTCFDVPTWIFLCLSYAIVVLVLHFSHVFTGGQRPVPFGMTVLSTFGVMFQEDSLSGFSNKKLRAYLRVQLMWKILTMFLLMFFLAVLKSVLTQKNYEKRTMTINEIIDKDMVLHTTAVTMAYFESPEGQQNPMYRRMACQTAKKNSAFESGNDYNAQIESLLLEKGGAVANLDASVKMIHTKYLRQGKDFPFIIIPDKIPELQSGMFFQKYDPRARYFDRLIHLMTECGIIEYLVRRALPYKDMKDHIQHKEERLVMEYYYLVFIPVLAGMVTGIVAFVFEVNKIRFVSPYY